MKILSQKYLFSILFFSILPIFSFGLEGKFEKKQFGPYRVELSQNFQSGLAKLVIKKGRDKAFEETELGSHYYFGNNFDETLEGRDLYSGHNITGNGISNLVVSNWTGGCLLYTSRCV